MQEAFSFKYADCKMRMIEFNLINRRIFRIYKMHFILLFARQAGGCNATDGIMPMT